MKSLHMMRLFRLDGQIVYKPIIKVEVTDPLYKYVANGFEIGENPICFTCVEEDGEDVFMVFSTEKILLEAFKQGMCGYHMLNTRYEEALERYKSEIRIITNYDA